MIILSKLQADYFMKTYRGMVMTLINKISQEQKSQYECGNIGNYDNIAGINAILIGLTDNHAGKMDDEFTGQIRGSLFTDSPAFGQGFDLPALNIQRGRDQGLRGDKVYVFEYRTFLFIYNISMHQNACTLDTAAEQK